MEKISVRCPHCGSVFPVILQREITSYTNINLEREKDMQRSRERMIEQLKRPLPSNVGYCNLQSYEQGKNLTQKQIAQSHRERQKGFV